MVRVDSHLHNQVVYPLPNHLYNLHVNQLLSQSPCLQCNRAQRLVLNQVYSHPFDPRVIPPDNHPPVRVVNPQTFHLKLHRHSLLLNPLLLQRSNLLLLRRLSLVDSLPLVQLINRASSQ